MAEANVDDKESIAGGLQEVVMLHCVRSFSGLRLLKLRTQCSITYFLSTGLLAGATTGTSYARRNRKRLLGPPGAI